MVQPVSRARNLYITSLIKQCWSIKNSKKKAAGDSAGDVERMRNALEKMVHATSKVLKVQNENAAEQRKTNALLKDLINAIKDSSRNHN